MTKGVLYVMAGTKHVNHLVVSLASLKDHWDGPVCIAAADDHAHMVVDKIIEDGRLGDVIKEDVSNIYKAKRNGAYFLKTGMLSYSPFDETVFIDADTLICGDFSTVWPLENEMVFTRFGNWVTTGNIMRGRLKKWKHVLPDRVSLMMQNTYPALNTGVLGFSKRCSKYEEIWRSTTEKNISFICDEIAAQLTYVDVDHRVLDWRYNASIVYSESFDDARIIHGHGFKFIRKERGRSIWLPRYFDALEKNYADIQSWTELGKHSPNNYLKKHNITHG